MKHNLIKGRRGFSLIELLVAVAILGIVVVPLLHAFVTSAQTAAKSRKIGEATLAAQNIAEYLDATSIGDIDKIKTMDSLANFTVYNYSQTVTSTDTTADKYAFELSNESAGGKFDAYVTLDTTAYAAQNLTEITQYTPMGAVFNQRAGANPDDSSIAYFDSHINALTDVKLDAGITRAYTRNIKLAINEKSADECAYVCTYSYTCRVDYTSAATGYPASQTFDVDYDYAFFDGAPLDADTLPAIYFFFDSYRQNSTDIIEITHTLADKTASIREVSVFVVCQGDAYPEGSEAVLRLRDQTYIQGSGSDMPSTKVFCNIQGEYYVFKDFINNNWFNYSETYSENLFDKKKENRLYAVEIKICDAGETEPIFTLETTKLD